MKKPFCYIVLVNWTGTAGGVGVIAGGAFAAGRMERERLPRSAH